MENRNEPLLLTPGPVTTSPATKVAMQRDWASRDIELTALSARIRERLTALACAQDSHVCVPIQGSGTFAIEATIGTLLPATGEKP